MLRNFANWSKNLAAMPRLVAEAADKLNENSAMLHRRLQFIDISNSLLSDALGVARVQTDATGAITSVSRSMCHLFGRTEQELLRIGYLNGVYPEDCDLLLEHWNNCIKNGSEFQYCCRIVTSDGEMRRICMQARPVFGINGHLEGYEGIARKEEELERLPVIAHG